MENIQKITENFNSDTANYYFDTATDWGVKLFFALLVFVIGRIIAKKMVAVFRKMLKKANIDDTLVSFLSNITYSALIVFVVISALGTLGVNTTSFAAVLAAAGLAVGLALQGSLSNFAAGVLIVIFRPFVKGDFVEAAGTSGSIEEVTIFTTTLKTPDNKVIIVPNGNITAGNIINYSREDTRRVDMVFGIGYSDDIKLAKEVLVNILQSNDKILKDPEPVVALSELADSSVNFICRPWVKKDDYWDVYWQTHEDVKREFDAKGISIPFPQRDVHIYEEKTHNKK